MHLLNYYQFEISDGIKKIETKDIKICKIEVQPLLL